MLAKLENDTLIIAPRKLHYTQDDREVFVVNPTEELLKSLGYMEVVEQEQPENAIPHYTQEDDKIVQTWEVIEVEEECNI